MRTEEVREGWRVSGRITGAGREDAGQEIALPFYLEEMERACGREGLFLRQWTLSRLVAPPQEPPHSHAERTLLTLEGVYGEGQLLIEGSPAQPLSPRMEVDLSEALRQGECLVQLCFAPHFPMLLPGEHGQELPVETALYAARIRSVYLLRIMDVGTERGDAEIRLHAYGAGKVRVCLRLLREEALLWSENFTVRICVGEQTIRRRIPGGEDFSGAVLQVRIDMGGEGCDERTVPFVQKRGLGKAYAHFRALPGEAMLRQVRAAGFDGIMLYPYAHEGIRAACAGLGLELREVDRRIPLRPLLRQDRCAASADAEECLCAPLRDESEGQQCLQAQKLQEAMLCARSAGLPVHVLAWGRQADAQDGLFDAQGEPRQALYAAKGALGRVAVWGRPACRMASPCAEFRASIHLLCADAEEQPAVIRAQLCLWNGAEVVSRSFAVRTGKHAMQAGELCAQLPWACTDGLVLRLQCWTGGRLVAQSHAYVPCTGERGRAKPFPSAEVLVEEDGALCNVSQSVAMGVTVHSGEKTLLKFGALLPGERIELAQGQQIVVKYGNPVKKDGALHAAQRILRGVLSHYDAAAADPQAGSR